MRCVLFYLFHRLLHMHPPSSPNYVAFADHQCIARGPLHEVVRSAKRSTDHAPQARILLFHGATSQLLDLDFHGTAEQVVSRAQQQYAPEPSPESEPAPPAPVSTGPGRPRLGVVAREVTLLPRHWEWLGQQPGGASVALRKLVEHARKLGESADRIRQAQEAAYRFMSAMAGDRTGFEEAARALFAGDAQRFEALTVCWPADIHQHLQALAASAFTAETATAEGGQNV